VALDALRRIEADGAYANLVLGPMLASSGLGDMDRRFVTELVYGTTRMRRACDAVIDRFVTSAPDEATRSVLRLGAYQLVFAGVAPHAAVSETVGLAPKRTRGFVNAVLRKVARLSVADMSWPSDGARLSYPDWMVDLFRDELGDDAVPALERMNQAPPVTERADGYVQDLSSQWVAAAVEARSDELVLDVCAAPGGKATAMAAHGATVVANDQRIGRARIVAENARTLGPPAAGGRRRRRAATVPGRRRSGPCCSMRRAPVSVRCDAGRTPGGGSSRATSSTSQRCSGACWTRRPRSWRPDGRLVYSVCTITAAESVDHPTPAGFEVDPTPPPIGSWRAFRQGWRVLPHDADTDGMVMIRYRRTS
jgi:16S rRNA (cytosine967-C5)-methyltransferase